MRHARRALFFFFLLLVAACGASSARPPPPPEPVPETCATRLPPRDSSDASAALPPLPPPAPTAPTFTAPRSTIVVNAELPLAQIKQALEAKVPRRVAEERDHDIGAAGRLEYTVDRGPFAVRVEVDSLVVEAPLLGNARACAKGRCYAGCAPQAKISARVPLRLGADYKLHASDVRIDVTHGCEVKTLGGFLTIDITPILRGALATQAYAVQTSINRELPDLRPQAARLWSELSRTRDLPLGMCVALHPEEITQGPATGNVELARLRFGLLARPEVRVDCAPSQPGMPHPSLPPLRDDPALLQVGDVHLAMVLPAASVARAVTSAAGVVDFGSRRARVARAQGDVTSGLLVDLAGEVCGDVTLTAGGVAWGDAHADPQALHLTSVRAAPGETERLAPFSLDPSRASATLEQAPIALPIAVGALSSTLPELARGMSDDHLTVTATVESAQPGAAGLRGASPVGVALLRGAVTLRAK